jgi:hypothetical protein
MLHLTECLQETRLGRYQIAYISKDRHDFYSGPEAMVKSGTHDMVGEVDAQLGRFWTCSLLGSRSERFLADKLKSQYVPVSLDLRRATGV